MTTPRVLTVAEMRAIWGAKGEAMSDAELEDIARRAYAFARVFLDTLKAGKHLEAAS